MTNDFEERMERKLDLIEANSGPCKAPDCDERAEWPREYCSTVCMNVGLEVAAETLESAAKNGSITRMEDIPDDRVAQIRRRNERTHERISKQVQEAIENDE